MLGGRRRARLASHGAVGFDSVTEPPFRTQSARAGESQPGIAGQDMLRLEPEPAERAIRDGLTFSPQEPLDDVPGLGPHVRLQGLGWQTRRP